MTKYDFEIKQGIKFTKSVYWKDSTNTAYDLTGWTALMELRKDFDSTLIIQLSIGSGLTLDETSGKVTITLTDTQTSAFDHEDFPCVYDLELTNDSGEIVKRLIEGTVTLSREVTLDE